MLEIKELTKEYGTGELCIKALDNVSLVIEAGDILAITGKSGSGKTTLLKMIGGIDYPTDGSVLYGEKNLSDYSNSEILQYRNRVVGFVFQDFKLVEELSVEENIGVPVKIAKSKIDKEYYQTIIENLELGGIERKFPNALSGGQQQRVAIARALINKPRMLLCDEPTGNLDKETGNHVIELLFHIRKLFQTTIIIVTHDPEIAGRCDKVVELSDGRIVSLKNTSHNNN